MTTNRIHGDEIFRRYVMKNWHNLGTCYLTPSKLEWLENNVSDKWFHAGHYEDQLYVNSINDSILYKLRYW